MKHKKTNKDIDEQNEGVSYEKGREFEKQFAKFLKEELKWDKVRVGAHMTGRNNAKGTSIDVFAERLDYVGEKYKRIANKWMIGSGVLAVGAIFWYIESWGNDGFWFFILSLLSILGGVIFRLLSDINNKQNAWVECKNLKTKVTVAHVNKTLNEFKDYKSSKNEDHRFTHHYFASASGYVENALKMCMDNNIACYVKSGDSFERVEYWNEK